LFLGLAAVVCWADPTDDLFQAITNKDVNAVRAALDRGASVNALARNIVNIGNISPLSHAVSHDAPEIVKLLLDRGADVNFKFPLGGGSCLSTAALHGNAAIVQLLLDHGAAIDVKEDIMGFTPLMEASSSGHDDVVKLLLDHGAQVELTGEHGETALRVAATAASAQLLLDHGAYVNSQDDQGVTALEHIAGTNATEILRLLLDRKAEVNHADKNGWTALFYSTRSGTPENAKLLLARGARWNDKDNKGNTPFYYAQSFANDAVMKVLVQAGANGGKMPPPVATSLSAADRAYLADTCRMQPSDIDVIARLEKDTQKFLLARVALRDCSLLKGFVASRDYFRQLKPNTALPMPPAGWDGHYLSDEEFKKYQEIMDSAPW
jgi:ankyrin repeat protein